MKKKKGMDSELLGSWTWYIMFMLCVSITADTHGCPEKVVREIQYHFCCTMSLRTPAGHMNDKNQGWRWQGRVFHYTLNANTVLQKGYNKTFIASSLQSSFLFLKELYFYSLWNLIYVLGIPFRKALFYIPIDTWDEALVCLLLFFCQQF